MPVRTKKDVAASLKKKGFQEAEGDHHWFIFYTADGRKSTIRTKTSHGATKDLGDGLLNQMARQLRISKDQFLNLIDCSLSREHYESVLKDSGHI